MLESMFRNLDSKALLDIMEAYDAYIFTACESRLIDTEWKPVGICEFYENEYQTAWQKRQALGPL